MQCISLNAAPPLSPAKSKLGGLCVVLDGAQCQSQLRSLQNKTLVLDYLYNTNNDNTELGITGWMNAAVARRKRAPALYIIAASVCFITIYML